MAKNILNAYAGTYIEEDITISLYEEKYADMKDGDILRVVLSTISAHIKEKGKTADLKIVIIGDPRIFQCALAVKKRIFNSVGKDKDIKARADRIWPGSPFKTIADIKDNLNRLTFRLLPNEIFILGAQVTVIIDTRTFTQGPQTFPSAPGTQLLRVYCAGGACGREVIGITHSGGSFNFREGSCAHKVGWNFLFCAHCRIVHKSNYADLVSIFVDKNCPNCKATYHNGISNQWCVGFHGSPARDVAKRQSPSTDNARLPLYCYGGKGCGQRVVPMEFPTRCGHRGRSEPNGHVIGWSKIACAHCQSTNVQLSIALEWKRCSSCATALHCGVTNQKGVTVH